MARCIEREAHVWVGGGGHLCDVTMIDESSIGLLDIDGAWRGNERDG